jgi:AcrR family transcriptional regulator
MRRYVSIHAMSMSEKTRQEVLAAVRRGMRRNKQATMTGLAQGAGVSVRTLYRLFGSREALMQELGYVPEPSVREHILAAALKIVGSRGLEALSMDDLATAAAVSRATLYRLFPGKSALFKGLMEAYSPWEAVGVVIEARPDGHPRDVMPAVARAMADTMDGRIGLLLPMVLEMVKENPDTKEGMRNALTGGLPKLVQYLSRQMAEGRLRRMNPIVAFQLLAGPIVVHLLTRPLAERALGLEMPVMEAVDQIAAAWLRSMLLDKRGHAVPA